ncbi:unnamed protein product [Ectocarpus sp. 12 AP-2014]
MMNGQVKSCLTAVIMLLAAAIRADGFVCPTGRVVSGRSAVSMSSLIQGSSSPPPQSSRWATSSSKLNNSPYEEYMALRQKKESGKTVTPEADQQISLFDSYMSSREKTAALPPAEKEKSLFEEYSSTRATVTDPGVGRPAAPPAPAAAAPAAPAAAPAKELSPYEEYMQSKNKVKAVEAATTFEEKAKSSVYADYMASRADTTGAAPIDCVEEECDADELQEQGGLFASYMASRGMQVEAIDSVVPEIECEDEEECTAEEELSFYESYMRSRNKVTEAAATVTPAEVETVSQFDSYTAARIKKDEAQAAMPPAQKQASMFDDYMSTQSSGSSSKTAPGHKGTGGMADTRDPAPVNHADPRKSISAAPSFAEYLKSKKN